VSAISLPLSSFVFLCLPLSSFVFLLLLLLLLLLLSSSGSLLVFVFPSSGQFSLLSTSSLH